MRVLLTTRALDVRAGSELYLFDVASWLRRHGHVPIVHSTHLGRVAAELRRQTIPVIDDLARLADPPDVIHVQHHLPAMTALARFPLAPAVYLCHGWLPWVESPPRHPGIRRYVAVSGATRERLVSESAVPPDLVRLLPNPVDLQRFQPGPSRPQSPARALIFSNQTNGHDWSELIREACAQRGITLDVAGVGCGRPLAHPEEHLGQYDLVFARGRSALEAMAVGAAVILCDEEGLGPLVTRNNIDRLRDGNFGIQVLTSPLQSHLVLDEIDRYDAAEAAATSQIVRDVHSLDRIARELVTIYEQAIEDVARSAHTIADAQAAHAVYLQWLTRELVAPDEGRTDHERARQQAVEKDLRSVAADRDALAGELARVAAEREALGAELGLIRSGFYFRRVLPPLWKMRVRLFPAGSARFRLLTGMRRMLRGLLVARPPAAATTPGFSTAPVVTPSNELQLSCVVLDAGGQPSLAEAVRSLAAQDPVPEIVVVSSGGGRANEIVAATGVAARVITSRQLLLPGAARNVGIAASHGTHVAFLACDCVAEPGWVAGRLDAHARGAHVVSCAMTNPTPWNPFATAAYYLLSPMRLPNTPAAVRLNYGLSVARSMFAKYGVFRNDLRIGEDTEFRERIQPELPIVFRADVRIAHAYTTTLRSLVRDQYARGRRAARAREILYGAAGLKGFVLKAFGRFPYSIWIGLRSTPVREWPKLCWGMPWMPVGAAAYALGARAEAKRPPPDATNADARARKPRLLCLLVFRNERRFLPGFLANIAPHVDGILALDDGSTDGSHDLVAAHPSVRELLRLEPNEPHVWDELRNRRVLIDAAGRHHADWLIALDADERVESGFRERANREMDRADRDGVLAYRIKVRELWGAPNQFRTDGLWGEKESARLFRYRRDHEFNTRALHGQWAPENSRQADGGWAGADLIMYHARMASAADRERRKARYMKLDPMRRWQPIGYEYLTDERGLVLETFVPGRGYTPLALEELAGADQFHHELEPVAIRES